GLASAEDLTSLVAARAALAQSEASLTSYLDAMRTAACSIVSSHQSSLIQASPTNRSLDLPPQYLVADRPQGNWVALREALDTKRISERYGYDFPDSSRNTLAAIDAEPEVATAKTNLDANLFDVQTAWNLAAADTVQTTR